jgi:hypothetical protein
MTGRSVNQEGTDHVVFPRDWTAISVSRAQIAQRNTGRVNRARQADIELSSTPPL